MQSFLIDMGFQLLSHSWQLFALVAGALMIGGMCLGMAKRTFVKLVDGGDFLAAKFMEKPRFLAVAGVILGLTVPPFAVGLSMAPTKIVTKEVPVPVTDNEMIERLQGELAAEQMKVGVAKAKAERLEEEKGAMEVRVAQTQAQMESVQKELNKIAPADPDADELMQLHNSLDTTHISRVEGEASNPRWRGGRFDYSNLRSLKHTAPIFGDTYYHLNCTACRQNEGIKRDIDKIWRRHPRWKTLADVRGQ